jgi:hypothetical protein
MQLRDARDGTELLNRRSEGRVVDVTHRGDTTWTHTAQIAYFSVTPAGRYGVDDDHLLRVGCGSSTIVTVAGQGLRDGRTRTLAAHDMEPVRMAVWMRHTLGISADAIEIVGGRMQIVVTSAALIATNTDTIWSRMHAITRASAEMLGPSPDTIALTIRADRTGSMTLFDYVSRKP